MQDDKLWQEVLTSGSADSEARALEQLTAQLRADKKTWSITLETLDGKKIAMKDWAEVPAGQLRIFLTVQNKQLTWLPKENKNLAILLRE